MLELPICPNRSLWDIQQAESVVGDGLSLGLWSLGPEAGDQALRLGSDPC